MLAKTCAILKRMADFNQRVVMKDFFLYGGLGFSITLLLRSSQ